MNKKGYTLVEIIIVIALLALLGGIFAINSIKLLNSNRVAKDEEKKTIIESAGHAYVETNRPKVYEILNAFGSTNIEIEDLVNDGFLNDSVLDKNDYDKSVLITKDVDEDEYEITIITPNDTNNTNNKVCTKNCDINNDGICDYLCDTNGDGICDKNCGGGTCTKNCDFNKDGICDYNCDTNGDGKCDYNCDINNDGKCDLNCDTNGDKICDYNCDTNGDGKCDLNCFTDTCTQNCDFNNDGKCDYNCDTNGDGKCDLNCDTNGDGKCDLNCDTNADGKCDYNCDTNGDGICDKNCINNTCTLNCDTNGDGICDYNCDTNGDGVCDTKCNSGKCTLNCDIDGDGKCDYNCDTNGDGVCDTLCNTDNCKENCDLDGDGVCDYNCDTNGDGICDYNCPNNVCTLNCDVNDDNICDYNCDIDGDSICDYNCEIIDNSNIQKYGLVAQDLFEIRNDNKTTWCTEKNMMKGYGATEGKSLLYFIYRNGERYNNENNHIKLTVENCTVNQNKPGNYKILYRYSYTESGKKLEGTRSRNVYIMPEEYEILYSANGGTGAPKSKHVTYSQTFQISTQKPTREGYDFLGWSYDRNATKAEYTSGQKIVFTPKSFDSEVTLYAVWKIKTFSVTVNVSNGTVSPSSATIDYGSNNVFKITANNKYKLGGATVSCSGNSNHTYNESNGDLNIYNVKETTTCSVTLKLAYYCTIGTLSGTTCIVSASSQGWYTTSNYDCNCRNEEYNCRSTQCNCYSEEYNCRSTSCGCYSEEYNCRSTSCNCHTEQDCDLGKCYRSCKPVSGQVECGDECEASGGCTSSRVCDTCETCSTRRVCDTCETCSTRRVCDTCETCSTRRVCDTCTSTSYYCGSGWSTYSGSGSSLQCSRDAQTG